MSERYIEKAFLYVLAASIVLHVAVFVFMIYFPQKRAILMPEPYMVELSEMPDLKPQQPLEEKQPKRLAEKRQRVKKETAPKGVMERDSISPQSRQAQTRPPQQSQQPATSRGEPPAAQSRSVDQGKGEMQSREIPRGEGVLKRREAQPDIARLFPGASKLSRLEETYRKKFGTDVEDGDTKFLDTNDFLFGSFLRRFETAIYGVWRYPPDAARLGIEGITPVKITFNSRGEIEKWEILQSSGSAILDREVERTLKLIGPIGSFPRGYKKDQFNLIAFFHYGMARGGGQGTLR